MELLYNRLLQAAYLDVKVKNRHRPFSIASSLRNQSIMWILTLAHARAVVVVVIMCLSVCLFVTGLLLVYQPCRLPYGWYIYKLLEVNNKLDSEIVLEPLSLKVTIT